MGRVVAVHLLYFLDISFEVCKGLAKCWSSKVQLVSSEFRGRVVRILTQKTFWHSNKYLANSTALQPNISLYFKQFNCGSFERRTGGRTDTTNFMLSPLTVGGKYSSEWSCHWFENHRHLLAISSTGLQFNVAYLSGFCFWIKPCLTCPDAKPYWAMRLSIFHLQAPTVKLLWSQRDPATSNVLFALKLGLFGCWFL